MSAESWLINKTAPFKDSTLNHSPLLNANAGDKAGRTWVKGKVNRLAATGNRKTGKPGKQAAGKSPKDAGGWKLAGKWVHTKRRESYSWGGTADSLAEYKWEENGAAGKQETGEQVGGEGLFTGCVRNRNNGTESASFSINWAGWEMHCTVGISQTVCGREWPCAGPWPSDRLLTRTNL